MTNVKRLRGKKKKRVQGTHIDHEQCTIIERCMSIYVKNSMLSQLADTVYFF